MGTDFLRSVTADVIRADSVSTMAVDRTKAVRLYCYSARSAWNLQVRAPLHLRNGRTGKAFLIATAMLTKEDLLALRDAIDVQLKEAAE